MGDTWNWHLPSRPGLDSGGGRQMPEWGCFAERSWEEAVPAGAGLGLTMPLKAGSLTPLLPAGP